jgi:CHAT domain-containing protein
MKRLSLGLILGSLLFVASSARAESEGLKLIREGHYWLDRGQYTTAINRIEQAKARFQKANDKEGVRGSLVSLSQAQLRSGQPISACWTLLEVLQLGAGVCQPDKALQPEANQIKFESLPADQPSAKIQLTALQTMGLASREIGKLEQSTHFFQAAQDLASEMGQTKSQALIGLDLANTQQSELIDILNRFDLTDDDLARSQLSAKAVQSATTLSQALRQLAQHPDSDLALMAELNWVTYYQSLQGWVAQGKSWPELEAVLNQNRTRFEGIIGRAISADFGQLPPIDAVNGRLKLAKALMTAHNAKQAIPSVEHPLTIAFQLAQDSYDQAKDIANERAMSYGLGTLGHLYLETEQFSLAEEAFTQAQNLAIANEAPEASYQWDWELAKLYQRRGDRTRAVNAYQSAIAALNDLRANRLGIARALQYSFRDEIQPVFQEYMQVLLDSPNPDLGKVVSLSETLQIIALENFLQCGKLVEFVPVGALPQPQSPTTFYVLDLQDRMEVVVRSKGQYHRYAADKSVIMSNIEELLVYFQEPTFWQNTEAEFLPQLQTLYRQLIAPGEHLIGQDKTVVVVANGVLQQIPVPILHDGSQYLVEKYAISASVGSQRRSARRSNPARKAIFFGLSKQSPSMDRLGLGTLPEVQQEAQDVAAALGEVTTYLDQAFTPDSLERKLTGRYDILHLATHGRFSSDPEQTYLLAWDDKLQVDSLDELVRGQSANGDFGLDLLFLSACQTAKGDEQAVLGLAGVATQAGATSTIASYWLANAEASRLLTAEFYSGLAAGLSKTKSLQQAQQKLLATEHYHHPFYWASFVLVGDWL